MGGAGYIGFHVCKALAERGHVPVAFDNLTSGHAHAVQWGPLVRGDVRNRSELHSAFRHHRPDAVMHFAAHIDVGQGEREPLAFWSNNVGAALALLEVMDERGVYTLIFSSSCAVYGRPISVPIGEDHPRVPESVYGRTKLAMEECLSDTAAASRLCYASLRYFNAAGASPDGKIGEEHHPETHLIPRAIEAALSGAPVLEVFGDDYPTPEGTCIRYYVHVSDLARAHVVALEKLIARPDSLVCNIGAGHGASVKEIIRAVEAVAGLPVPHVMSARRPGDLAGLVADTRRAKALLGFNPERSSLEQIVSDAWGFHQRRHLMAGRAS